MRNLSEITAASMNSKTIMSDESLESELSKLRVGAQLRTNGQRDLERTAAKILSEAARAGKRADKAAAHQDKIEKAIGNEDAAAMTGEANFLDLGNADGGDVEGGAAMDGEIGAEAAQEAALEEMNTENRIEAAERVADLGKAGFKKSEIADADVDTCGVDDDGDDAEADQNISDIEDVDELDDEAEEIDSETDDEENESAAQTMSKQSNGNKTAKASKKTDAMADDNDDGDELIVTDPDEIERENAKATNEDGTLNANDIDNHLMAEIKKNAPAVKREIDEFVAEENEKKRRKMAPKATATAKKGKGKAAAAAAAGDEAEEDEDPREKARREQQTYYEEHSKELPIPLLTNYLTVITADYMRGTPSATSNKKSIYGILSSVNLTSEKFDDATPLLNTTAEKLRADVALMEGITGAMLSFIQKGDPKAYGLIAYSLLGGINKVNIVQFAKDTQEATNELSASPTQCSVLCRQVFMHDTRLLHCTGWEGEGPTRKEIKRDLRVCKPLAPLIVAINNLTNFKDVATAAVQGRANGKVMRQMMKEKEKVKSAVDKLVNESVGDSALITLKKAFKAAAEAVRSSVNKFDEANKLADKFDAEAVIAAQKKSSAAPSYIVGEEDSEELGASRPADVDDDADDDDDDADAQADEEEE
jgi:hypothetical protein